MMTYPYLGIAITKNENGQWTVSRLDEESGSLQLDIRIGDVIASIDGMPAERNHFVSKWGYIEQANMIEIERGGHLIQIDTSKIRNSLSLDLLPLIGEALSFFMAFLLFAKVLHSRSARTLSLVFCCVGVALMSVGASVRGDSLGKFLITAALGLIPVLFLHFFLIFLNEKGNLQPKTGFLKYLYAAVCLNAVFGLVDSFVNNAFHGVVSQVTVCLFLFGIVLNVLFIVKYYFDFRKETSYMAAVIRSILVSLLISFFPVVCLSFIPKVLVGYELVLSPYTSLFVLFFPISFAYLIMSRQLFDIDMLLRRIYFTAIVSFVPSVLITVLYGLLLFPNTANFKVAFAFIITLILLSCIFYSLEYIYTRLERVMFPRKHILQAALKKISKNLTSASSFRDLKELILVDIVATLQVLGGAIVFCYKDSTEMIVEGEISEAEIQQFLNHSNEKNSMYTFIEVNRHEEYTSYLVMTEKRNNTRLGLEEVQWLNLIVSYLAVSLENVYLIRKLTSRLEQLAANLPDEMAAADLNWFRKITFELQERERVRIASDLHDTTLQDLFFLKRKLAALNDNVQLPDEVRDAVRNLIEYVEVINVNLRQSCFDLHPYLLQEIGLIGTLRKWIEREAYSCPFEIRFEPEGIHQIERLSLETKRHLFRIVQEMLNNAKKHSEATLIRFRLAAANGRLDLYYEDNGVGFDPNRIIAPEIGSSGIGIEQMRSRVLHLHGRIEFDSKRPGVGIHVTFPLKEGLTA
jgi:two-component system sensor histidine kinase ComP